MQSRLTYFQVLLAEALILSVWWLNPALVTSKVIKPISEQPNTPDQRRENHRVCMSSTCPFTTFPLRLFSLLKQQLMTLPVKLTGMCKAYGIITGTVKWRPVFVWMLLGKPYPTDCNRSVVSSLAD
jgi:hypothetical protein